jgi:hypothetical protein
MRKYLSQLWHDDAGYVLAMEWIFVVSLLTLATVAGLVALHRAGDDCAADWPAAVTR